MIVRMVIADNEFFFWINLFSMNVLQRHDLIFWRIFSAYHYAHYNAGPSGVYSSVDLRSANSDVAVEGDGAHAEEGADAGGQTQWRRHLAQQRVVVEIILPFEDTYQKCRCEYSTWRSKSKYRIILVFPFLKSSRICVENTSGTKKRYW